MVPWTVTGWSGLTRSIFLALTIAAVTIFIHRRSRREEAHSNRIERGQSLVTSARTSRFFQLILPLLLWLDVLSFGPRPNPTVPLEVHEPGLARRELHLDPLPKVGESRAMVSRDAEVALNANPLTNRVAHVLYNRMGLLGNNNLLDDIPKI